MRLFILGLLFLSTSIVQAQKDSTKTSFLSHIFFPSDYGISIPGAPELESAVQFRTGLEYRFDRINGFFIRGSLDSRATAYEVPTLELPLLTKGKIKHTELLLGLGFRIGDGKWRNNFLVQSGIGFYQFPTVENTATGFIGLEKGDRTGLARISFGTERYISRTAALTFDVHSSLFFQDTPFWQKKTNFGFAVGLSTGPF